MRIENWYFSFFVIYTNWKVDLHVAFPLQSFDYFYYDYYLHSLNWTIRREIRKLSYESIYFRRKSKWIDKNKVSREEILFQYNFFRPRCNQANPVDTLRWTVTKRIFNTRTKPALNLVNQPNMGKHPSTRVISTNDTSRCNKCPDKTTPLIKTLLRRCLRENARPFWCTSPAIYR